MPERPLQALAAAPLGITLLKAPPGEDTLERDTGNTFVRAPAGDDVARADGTATGDDSAMSIDLGAAPGRGRTGENIVTFVDVLDMIQADLFFS